jgi:hypothetical protein
MLAAGVNLLVNIAITPLLGVRKKRGPELCSGPLGGSVVAPTSGNPGPGAVYRYGSFDAAISAAL